MIGFGILFAASGLMALAEPLESQLRAAIWNDLQLNAMIGNGNWIGSLWYQASSGNVDNPDLHIEQLECRTRGENYACSFILFREGGVATVLREQAPDRLSCEARFVPLDGEEGWSVQHIPPRRAGHSRTTMECKDASN